MDNSQSLEKENLVAGTGEEYSERQETFPEDANQVPKNTIEQIDASVDPSSVSSKDREKVEMEMPPEVDKDSVNNTNLMISHIGDDKTITNSEFKDTKNSIIRASSDPFRLNEAIEQVSERITGVKP